MKIILTHDIDHLMWSDHYFKDYYIPARIIRNFISLLNRQISFNLFFKRMKMWGRMHRIPELLNFYKDLNIKANFFIGMDNALGLSYNYKKTEKIIRSIQNDGHFLGVHGIDCRTNKGITKELSRFQEISDIKALGYRTHYLRWSGYTYSILENHNIQFDSSMMGLFKPYKVGSLWEIPISIMDVSVVERAQENNNIDLWNKNTNIIFEKALNNNIPYFVINFHDVYFDSQFFTMKEWYKNLVFELQKKYQIISFEDAVLELEIQQKSI